MKTKLHYGGWGYVGIIIIVTDYCCKRLEAYRYTYFITHTHAHTHACTHTHTHYTHTLTHTHTHIFTHTTHHIPIRTHIHTHTLQIHALLVIPESPCLCDRVLSGSLLNCSTFGYQTFLLLCLRPCRFL